MSAPGIARAGQFVEASAGTGKTTQLVAAIVQAIAEGVAVDRIVAVTFTHMAAGEMKLRVRQRLGELETPVARAARESLDRAFIGTIHSFCASLLRQRPVEAGVDPDFTEMDEGESRRFFGRVFREWFTGSMDQPAVRRALARLAWRAEKGLSPLESLEGAAWALAEWRDHDGPWQRRPFDRVVTIRQLLLQLRDVCRIWPQDRSSKARTALADLYQRFYRAAHAEGYDPDEAESELLSIARRFYWVEFDKSDAAYPLWKAFRESLNLFRREANADLAAALRDDLWQAVTRYQKAKREAGLVDFTDLLLYARDLLRHPGARQDLRARYERVFVDEFQDTDPLQAEIVTALADPADLFVVGDPKQCIYRFRRAEPLVYEAVRASLLEQGAERRELSLSYRSTEEIQTFVNAAFDAMPRYLPLTGGEPGPVDQPGVVALPIPCGASADLKEVVTRSPGTTAAFVQWVLRESGWTVRVKDGPRVPVAEEHICILFRRAVSNGVDLTQEYVRSLEARGIGHVLVGSKGLHAREETGALRAALRAIESPDDDLSLYATLRGPFFGISDSTIFKYKRAADKDDPEFEAIEETVGLLRELHKERNRRPIADTMRRLLEAARVHAAFGFQQGGDRRLANLHRLSDIARQAESRGMLSFRAFVEYLEDEARTGEASEAPVLEQNAGGVRMMTVHKAKGLEFPVVILADVACHLTHKEPSRYVDSSRNLCAQQLLYCAPWDLVEKEAEEQRAEQEEAVRAAYVAATRARDVLVVTSYMDKPPGDSWLTPLNDAVYPPGASPRRGRSHVPRAGSQPVFWFDTPALDLRDPAEATSAPRLDGNPAQMAEARGQLEAWRARRGAVLNAGTVPGERVVLATEAGGAPEAAAVEVKVVRLELEGVRPSGRRFGRLLHDMLQTGGDAATHGRRLDATGEEVRAAEEAVRRVREHPLLADAGTRMLREYPLMVRLDDGRLVEGRADLVRDEGDSWTVIDYKTDFADQARYRRQLQLYAYALARATGKPARGILLEI